MPVIPALVTWEVETGGSLEVPWSAGLAYLKIIHSFGISCHSKPNYSTNTQAGKQRSYPLLSHSSRRVVLTKSSV